MPLPTNTAPVLTAIGYRPLVDFLCTSGETVTLQWLHVDPQPTEQQINDWATDAAPLPSGQLFSVWLAEHGGDALLTLRRLAKEALDEQEAGDHALIRAVVVELLDYCNTQRQQHNALLTWLGAQGTLANRGQLTAMQLAEATPTQARTSIKSRIDAGNADT